MDFQTEINVWMQRTFNYTNGADVTEAFSIETRALRFLEEAVELFQAVGMSQIRAEEVVDYVFNRPQGKPSQEVGGVMVTLAALCAKETIDLEAEAWREFFRIDTIEMMEKIRNKQKEKPQGLPTGNYFCARCGLGHDHKLDRDFHQEKCNIDPF